MYTKDGDINNIKTEGRVNKVYTNVKMTMSAKKPDKYKDYVNTCAVAGLIGTMDKYMRND